MASAPNEEDAGQVNKVLNLSSVGDAADTASKGGHKSTLDSQHPPIQVDYVIVFSLAPPAGSKASRTSHAQSLKHEYATLLEQLRSAGLQATGRPGGKGKNEVLILVKASEARVKEEVEKERLTDWLHGITSTTPTGPRKKSDFAAGSYTPAERLRHVHDIITQLGPSPNSPTSSVLAGPGAGVQPKSGQFPHVKSIFPPHDPAFNRRWLQRWSDRRHVQGIPDRDLDDIRDHFGEAIAYYFAFLRAYWRALAFPTLIGVATWFLGWEYSPLYSVCLVLWATAFTESWAVRERIIGVKWSTHRCGIVERRRSEFHPSEVGPDPVTGQQIGRFPWWKRQMRELGTVPVLAAFAVFLAGLITSITAVELLVNEVYNGPGKMYLSLLPTILFSALVPQLVSLWQSVALRLTSWENHAHESNYERSLTLKMFALNMVPAYLGLTLTAFIYIPFGQLIVPRLASLVHAHVVKERIPGVTGDDLDGAAFDWRSYEINGERLHKQILAYTVTGQIINAFTELGLPIIMRFVGNKVTEYKENGKGKEGVKQAKEGGMGGRRDEGANGMDEEEERAFLERIREEASLPEYTLFVDYAEMIVQFGYCVVWTVVWPIAPLFAFINNFFELRGDALKLATQCRRPLPRRTDTIGPWLEALRFLAWLGALVNAALIYLFRPSPESAASTSGFIAKAIKGEPLVQGTDAGAGEKTAAFVTSHIGKAMNLATTGSAEGDANAQSQYYTLRGVLFSALLVALAAEHVQLLARGVARYLAERLLWRDGEADVKQRKAEWELKRSFLATINMDTNGRKLVRGDTGEGGSMVASLREDGETSEEGKRFWARPDAGLAEVERATKTE